MFAAEPWTSTTVGAKSELPSSPVSLLPPGLTRRYDRNELIADALVHVAGIALALCGSAFLLVRARPFTGQLEYMSLCLYCLALLTMLGFSFAYNLWPVESRKWVLRRCDQSSIYVAMVASLTPLALHGEPRPPLTELLPALWGLAFIGVGSRLCCEVRFTPRSVAPYFAFALAGILGFAPVWTRIPAFATCLFLSGCAIYSIGVIFYLWERLRFNNVIWHCFVLTGATCHYLGILVCALS